VNEGNVEKHTEQGGRSVRACPKAEAASARTTAAYLILAVVVLVDKVVGVCVVFEEKARMIISR
jgi:hypothetical protein